MPPTAHYLESNFTIGSKIVLRPDAKLHVATIGSGKPLILLHGFPEFHHQWLLVAERLASNNFCILPDTRGCGWSTRPATGYDMENLVADVMAIVDSFGIEAPFPIVGHDIGGMIATAFAIRHSDRVSHLINFEGPPPGLTYDGWENVITKFWHFNLFAEQDLPEMLITGREREFFGWFIRQHAYRLDLLTPEITNIYADVIASDGGLRAALTFYRLVGGHASWFETAKKLDLQTKTHVLGAGGEHCLGRSIGHLLASVFKSVETRVVKESGHWVAEENPQEVSALIREFTLR